MSGFTETELRRDLALAYRLLEKFKLNEGVCNHLTAELDDGTFLVIPHGGLWESCTPDQLLRVDAAGAVVEGAGSPELTATCIHAAAHKALGPRGRVIFHTHMSAATALTCLKPDRGGRLLPIHQNACRFINCSAYDEHYGGLGRSAAEGQRIASCFGEEGTSNREGSAGEGG